MDVFETLRGPFQDKMWWKKCGLMGLYCAALGLIPLAGLVLAPCNLWGWMKAAYVSRRHDGDIPPPGFHYWREGLSVLVAVLPGGLIAFFFVSLMILGVLVDVTALSIIGATGLALDYLVMFPLAPALEARHLVFGDRFSSVAYGRGIALIRAHTKSYMALWVLASIGASIISQLGVLACGVGLLVSIPLAACTLAFAHADFADTIAEEGADVPAAAPLKSAPANLGSTATPAAAQRTSE